MQLPIFLLLAVIILFEFSSGTQLNAAIVIFHSSDGPLAVPFFDYKMGVFWRDQLAEKAKNPSWPVNMTVELIDCHSSSKLLRKYASARANDTSKPPVAAWILPVLGIEDIDFLSQFNITTVSPIYPANVYTQNLNQGPYWKYTFSMTPAVDTFFKNLAKLYKSVGVKTYALAADGADHVLNPGIDWSYGWSICRGSQTIMEANGIKLIDSYFYDLFTATEEELTENALKVEKLNPDAFLLCTVGNSYVPNKWDLWYGNIFRKINYAPKAFGLIGTEEYAARLQGQYGNLINFMAQPTYAHPDLSGVDYTERNTPFSSYFAPNPVPITVDEGIVSGTNIGNHSSSSRLFYNWYLDNYGIVPTYYAVSIWSSYEVVEAALYNAALVTLETLPHAVTISSEVMLTMMSNTNLPTPLGRIVFDEYNVATTAEPVVIQWFDGKTEANIVDPSSLASHPFVYPMPTWDERVYSWSLLKGSAKKSMAVSIAGSIIILAIMVTLIIHREQQDVKMLNHYHMCAMLFCCLVVIWGLTFVWQGDVKQSQCNSLLWVIYLPGSFVIQLINMKAYRLSVFLTSDSKTRLARLSHNKVMLLTLGWVSITAGFLLIAQLADPPTKTTIVVDKYRPSLDYNICRYHSVTTGILAFLIAQHVLMAMACVIVVRNGSSAFKDGLIAKESFVILFSCIAITFIFDKLNISSQDEYFLRTLFVGMGFALFSLRLLASRCLKHWIPLQIAIPLSLMYKEVVKHLPASMTSDSKVYTMDRKSTIDEHKDNDKWLVEQIIGKTSDDEVNEMMAVFDDEKRFELFRKLCEKSLILENVDFLNEVRLLPKKATESMISHGHTLLEPVLKIMEGIKERYCVDGAEYEVNISHNVRSALKAKLDELNKSLVNTPVVSQKVATHIVKEDLMEIGGFFDPAVKEIRNMLYQNIWDKFKGEETEIKMM